MDFNFTLKPTQDCLHRSALPHYCPRTKRAAVNSQWRDRRGAIRPLFPSSIAESVQSSRGWEGKTAEERQLFKSNAGLCGLYWRPNKSRLERVFCHLSCPLLCAVLQFNTMHRNRLCTISCRGYRPSVKKHAGKWFRTWSKILAHVAKAMLKACPFSLTLSL